MVAQNAVPTCEAEPYVPAPDSAATRGHGDTLAAMTEAEVSLTRLRPDEHTLLSNLMELYVHDLSVLFPQVELGADGRFGYAKLPLFMADSERHFAFLIRAGARTAGFVLATHGSPGSEDAAVHDVAEFFVLRRYRRSGVGRQAAALLFQAFPGPWTVRVLERNTRALMFWRRAVLDFTRGSVHEAERRDASGVWRVFGFDVRADGPANVPG
jgi:predicted acetyltransferase